MAITHPEARRLIQFNADQALTDDDRRLLAWHLQGCTSCREYARDLKEVEDILLPALKRHWDREPSPFPIDILLREKLPRREAYNILATRTALIGLLFLAFLVGAWQFTLSNGWGSIQTPAQALAVPTPSQQITSTRILTPNCQGLVYRVQEKDTLQRIAERFSIPVEELMAANGLVTSTLNTATELIIPLCTTPTRALLPTELTGTYAPSHRAPLSTPGS